MSTTDLRSFSHNFSHSLEYLKDLKLPKVPALYCKMLEINWLGSQGKKVPSAVSAITDKKGEPKTQLTFKYKTFTLKEEMTHKILLKEFPAFMAVAKELA